MPDKNASCYYSAAMLLYLLVVYLSILISLGKEKRRTSVKSNGGEQLTAYHDRPMGIDRLH